MYSDPIWVGPVRKHSMAGFLKDITNKHMGCRMVSLGKYWVGRPRQGQPTGLTEVRTWKTFLMWPRCCTVTSNKNNMFFLISYFRVCPASSLGWIGTNISRPIQRIFPMIGGLGELILQPYGPREISLLYLILGDCQCVTVSNVLRPSW